MPAGVLILISGAYLNAFASVRDVRRPSTVTGNISPIRSVPSPSIPNSPSEVLPLKVQNVRFEAAPAPETSHSATLKFDMFNDGSSSLTDIVLEVSVLKKPEPKKPNASQQVLVHPFTIREKVVLQPGFSMNYEVRFRNISADSDYLAQVTVVSVRPVVDPGSSR